MTHIRKAVAVFWLLAVFGYGMAQPVYSNWWMLKTVVIGAFVFGLIWPDEKKESAEEK